jgi:hypothetical protein
MRSLAFGLFFCSAGLGVGLGGACRRSKNAIGSNMGGFRARARGRGKKG